MQFVAGPDFPTGGIIYGRDGIREAYETGRGRIVMRARAEIEEKEAAGEQHHRHRDPVHGQQGAHDRADRRAGARQEDRRTSRDLRDESDREGIRIVIELKRDAIPHIVLNQLFKHTQMQTTFGVIMLALVRRRARRCMPLKRA